MRKIIQISVVADNGGAGVFALCDDGSVWVLDLSDYGTLGNWEQLEAIPQPKEREVV